MPFNNKITVALKGKRTTAVPLNTIKVFYHPLSVVADVEEAAGERYFFMEKPKALFEALQKEGLNFKHHTYEPFTWKDFELCHDPGYVGVRGGSGLHPSQTLLQEKY